MVRKWDFHGATSGAKDTISPRNHETAKCTPWPPYKAVNHSYNCSPDIKRAWQLVTWQMHWVSTNWAAMGQSINSYSNSIISQTMWITIDQRRPALHAFHNKSNVPQYWQQYTSVQISFYQLNKKEFDLLIANISAIREQDRRLQRGPKLSR